MHCDDKRTIFALNKSLGEALQTRENLIKKVNHENSLAKKNEISIEIDKIEKFIAEIKDQLNSTE